MLWPLDPGNATVRTVASFMQLSFITAASGQESGRSIHTAQWGGNNYHCYYRPASAEVAVKTTPAPRIVAWASGISDGIPPIWRIHFKNSSRMSFRSCFGFQPNFVNWSILETLFLLSPRRYWPLISSGTATGTRAFTAFAYSSTVTGM